MGQNEPSQRDGYMNEEDLRKLLLIGFEYSYLHDDWVNPLKVALAGLTAEQVRWRPDEGMGIWDIVLHLAVWNENIVARVSSGEAVRPEEGAWPPLPAVTDEVAWVGAKKRLWDSLDSVRSMIEATPVPKLLAAPYGPGDLLCRFIHMGYHIGQITKMRECVAASVGSHGTGGPDR